MKRIATLILAACFCIGLLAALRLGAAATPTYEMPSNWTYQALDSLAADGLLDGYPGLTLQGDRPRTREQVAKLVARIVAKLQLNGAGNASKADLDIVTRLMHDYKYELVLLGVRASDVDDALKPDNGAKPARTFQIQAAVAADASFRQRNGVPHTIAGGSIDPFVNAFLTSPVDNNPFEHDPGAGTTLRFDGKVSPTFTLSENLAISVPIHVIQYDGPLVGNDQYLIQPAVVVNAGKFGSLSDVYLRGGQLDNLESSALSLTYRAPDATQQGPGFQNPVQPYENGVEIGGALRGLTQFQFSWARLDQSFVNTFPGNGDEAASNNYFLVVTPSQSSLIQPGAPTVSAGPSHTDTYSANAGPVPFVYLSVKAAVGSVYISAVNGVLCSPAGLTPSGASCPIPIGAWYYIDRTNQVVFQSPLPVGAVVQITYSTQTSNNPGGFPRDTYGFQREHYNARVNQQIKGLPGTEVGLSFSRIVDTGGTSSSRLTGYGAVSDTVVGLDARVPLTFIGLGRNSESPVLYAEGAYSKYTPDFFNTPAITDSAMAAGVRLKVSTVRATLQYQAVGPNFLDGGPLRFLGPAPATFQFWRGNYFPQFYGFGNNLAINQIFDKTVTPGCVGTACSSSNPLLTYIYPVFNPFEASGPQYYSAYAPNSQGLTTTVAGPLGKGDNGLKLRFLSKNLQELIPNGFGQLAYGPGFGSDRKLKFNKYEGGMQFGLPLFNTQATFTVIGSAEQLYRRDMTAYSYVPFNVASGGPDASSAAALNAYLSMPGNTPVLFYPNYIDEFHWTLAPSVTIPFTPALNMGIADNTQEFRGSYATTLTQNILQHKNDFVATLTYTIPKSRGTIGLLLDNRRYDDSVLPAFNFDQNREAIDYTIRW